MATVPRPPVPELVPMAATRIVMHQLVLPADVDMLGICLGGQVGAARAGRMAGTGMGHRGGEGGGSLHSCPSVGCKVQKQSILRKCISRWRERERRSQI